MPGYTNIYDGLKSGTIAGEPDVAWLNDTISYTGTDGLNYSITRSETDSGEVKLGHYQTYLEARKAMADYYANWRNTFATLARTARYRAEHEMWANTLPRRLRYKSSARE